jgi:hypothetical protein
VTVLLLLPSVDVHAQIIGLLEFQAAAR